MVLFLAANECCSTLKKALVTVSSKSYLAGTQLLFYSFIKHHAKLKIELIVIHDDLDKNEQHQLKQWFGVKCIGVEEKLSTLIRDLVQVLPKIQNRSKRLYSLQAFNLKQFESVLFVDSDIIFRKNIAELFELEESFSACLDMHSLEGGKRNLEDFSTESGKEKQFTFNAGLFHFRPPKLDQAIYHKLLERISVERFSKLKSGHTDQFVLNQEYGDVFYHLDSKYNTFVSAGKTSTIAQENKDAAVWHYLRHPKPWKQKAWIKQFFKGNKVPFQLKVWNQLFFQFSKEVKRKMTWQEKVLNTIILLISSRD